MLSKKICVNKYVLCGTWPIEFKVYIFRMLMVKDRKAKMMGSLPWHCNLFSLWSCSICKSVINVLWVLIWGKHCHEFIQCVICSTWMTVCSLFGWLGLFEMNEWPSMINMNTKTCRFRGILIQALHPQCVDRLPV